MRRINKGFFVLSISLLTLLTIFIGCEDPGSVGSEFVDRPELTFDTLTIDNTDVLSYIGYSGRLGFIPIGQYSDPVFGDIEAVGLFKPSRNPSIPDSVDLDDNFQLHFKLQVDSLESYGDTTTQSSFSIYEITSAWRGNALRMDDEIQFGNQVASFTIGQGEEEIFIRNLSQEWVTKYRSFYRNSDEDADSLYNNDFGGLIIVSDQDNSKISFPRSDQSRFLMISGAASDTTDTINVALRDWGFTLERSGAVTPQATFPLHTTLEGMMSISIPDSILRADNDSKNIIRADLVFYEAEDILTANLPPNHLRLEVATLNLDLVEPLEPEYEYQFGQVDFSGSNDEEEPFFKINVTNFINNVIFGGETRRELILGAGSSSGALRSTLIYNETAPDEFKPIIIITSLVD